MIGEMMTITGGIHTGDDLIVEVHVGAVIGTEILIDLTVGDVPALAAPVVAAAGHQSVAVAAPLITPAPGLTADPAADLHLATISRALALGPQLLTELLTEEEVLLVVTTHRTGHVLLHLSNHGNQQHHRNHGNHGTSRPLGNHHRNHDYQRHIGNHGNQQHHRKQVTSRFPGIKPWQLIVTMVTNSTPWQPL